MAHYDVRYSDANNDSEYIDFQINRENVIDESQTFFHHYIEI